MIKLLPDVRDARMKAREIESAQRTICPETAFGPRYHVDGIIETPDGRNPKIKTVWQVDIGSNSPRLITAHPLGG